MLNVAVLMGRLTADPEIRYTPNDIPVTTFCIAVDRRFSRQGAEKETDFIYVTAWRNTAEFVCKYFQKGSMIAVQGSIRVDNYTDRDGNNRTRTEVIADQVSFCGSKRETQTHGPDMGTPADQLPPDLASAYQRMQKPAANRIQRSDAYREAPEAPVQTTLAEASGSVAPETDWRAPMTPEEIDDLPF